LSYNNHYFWWRPSGARVLRDNVFMGEVQARKGKEQAKKKRKKEQKEQKQKKKKK
jgi:hypothetical protein